MVHISIIEAKLAKLGIRVSRWFKPEVRELQHILMDNEEIMNCVQGRYFGGFALLVATDRRLLLIDKKIPYLSVEDIRYDMISVINYSSRLYDATIEISTVNKQHKFTSIRHRHHIRPLSVYAQQRVMEMRQYQSSDLPSSTGVVSNTPFSARRAYSSSDQSVPVQQIQVQPQIQSYVQPQIQETQALPEPQQHQSFIRLHFPSTHVPHKMGATAVAGARRWVNPNPYATGSLVVRKQWSRSS